VSLGRNIRQGFINSCGEGFYNAAGFAKLYPGRNKARLQMRWFRSHRLKVASLALFALTCQFVLSFGHVHLDRFAGNAGNWAVAAAAGKAVAAAPGKVTLADLPISPRQKNPSGLGDDFCAICANISLAGALVAPTAPTLLPAIAVFKELHWSFAATRARPIDHIHFNARGPPVA
jgi:hypothetical protein